MSRLRASVVVGDAPLTGETFRAGIRSDPGKLREWRELAGGRYAIDEIIEALKDTSVRLPGQSKPVRMREAMGEDAAVFPWLATNLYHNDPDMLTALIDDMETSTTGYDMETVLPAIRCPVLLLQANPASGGLMIDAEVEQALPLLAQPAHVRLEGISHVLHNEQKGPVLQAIFEFLTSLEP